MRAPHHNLTESYAVMFLSVTLSGRLSCSHSGSSCCNEFWWTPTVSFDCRWRIAKHWQKQENYLARYSSPDLAGDDFSGWEDVFMQPGDLLYLPRGGRHPNTPACSPWSS